MNLMQEFLCKNTPFMLDDLAQFVKRETPSTDKHLLDKFAEFLATYAETKINGQAEILPMDRTGNHVRVRWGSKDQGPPILLLGHYDTVWPAGTVEKMPFTAEAGVAKGPGIFDMKCGL